MNISQMSNDQLVIILDNLFNIGNEYQINRYTDLYNLVKKELKNLVLVQKDDEPSFAHCSFNLLGKNISVTVSALGGLYDFKVSDYKELYLCIFTVEQFLLVAMVICLQ